MLAFSIYIYIIFFLWFNFSVTHSQALVSVWCRCVYTVYIHLKLTRRHSTSIHNLMNWKKNHLKFSLILYQTVNIMFFFLVSFFFLLSFFMVCSRDFGLTFAIIRCETCPLCRAKITCVNKIYLPMELRSTALNSH